MSALPEVIANRHLCFVAILEKPSPWGLCSPLPTPQPCHQGSTFFHSMNAAGGRWGCHTFQLTTWPEIVNTAQMQMHVLFMRHSVGRPSGADNDGDSESRGTLREMCLSQNMKRGMSGLVTCHLTRRQKRQRPTLQGAPGQDYYANQLGGICGESIITFEALEDLQSTVRRKPPVDEWITLGD